MYVCKLRFHYVMEYVKCNPTFAQLPQTVVKKILLINEQQRCLKYKFEI